MDETKGREIYSFKDNFGNISEGGSERTVVLNEVYNPEKKGFDYLVRTYYRKNGARRAVKNIELDFSELDAAKKFFLELLTPTLKV